MTRTLLAFPLATLAVFGLSTPTAAGQEAKMARGTVTAITADSLTVKVRDQEMKFNVDSKTNVVATGAGTQARRAAAAGKPGPALSDVIKTGQAVEVRYHETGQVRLATRVRRILSTGSGAGSTAETRPAVETSSGTVKSIAGDSLTITGSSGGGATFTQTFAIDATTKVVGVGAGTATAAKGGRIAFTELVGAGDKVTVSYRKGGSALHADNVRVTSKAVRGTR